MPCTDVIAVATVVALPLSTYYFLRHGFNSPNFVLLWQDQVGLKSLDPGKVTPRTPYGRHFGPGNDQFLFSLSRLHELILIRADRLLYRCIKCVHRFLLPTHQRSKCTSPHCHHVQRRYLAALKKKFPDQISTKNNIIVRDLGDKRDS